MTAPQGLARRSSSPPLAIGLWQGHGTAGAWGTAAAAAAAVDGAAASRELGWKPESAPCDMDSSLKLEDPPKSYNGIRVEFPFKTPMNPQEQVMQRVVNAAKSRKHALLESPTGTGKSAASILADGGKKDATCPNYRSMSSSRVAKLLHEFARPKVGLAGGSNGNHDIEDLRASGRDPHGHTDKTRVERERWRGGANGGGGERASGCGDGGCGSGGCSSSSSSNGGWSSGCATNQAAAAAGAGAAGASLGAGGSGAPVPVPAGGEALVDLTYDTSDDDADAAQRTGVAGSGSAAAAAAARESATATATAAAAAAAEGWDEQADPHPHLLACPFYMSHVVPHAPLVGC
eukprot:g6037.t1